MDRSAREQPREPDYQGNYSDPTEPYVQSYLLIRTVVGIIGIVLPFVFIIGEAFYLRGGVHVRGSISAYYHTDMRDVFVAGLCVVGVLLGTYMSGKVRSWAFWLSLVAGVAVLVVVFFPTTRPSLSADAAMCGVTPMPAGCAPIQQLLGEQLVATIHFVGAGVFIVTLALISFSFARERGYKESARMRIFQYICGAVIIAAALGVVVSELTGIRGIGELTPLYLGEVISIWAFGASWFSKGKDLQYGLRLVRLKVMLQPTTTSGEGPMVAVPDPSTQ
jgi:hypothetical protein